MIRTCRNKDGCTFWVANHITFKVNFKFTTQYNADMTFFAPVRFNKFIGELDQTRYFPITRK